MLNGRAKILLIILCMVGILIGISGISVASSIVRYNSDWPVLIDPAVAIWCQGQTAVVNLYDALVITDTESNIISHVAKSWDVSSDGLTFTFYLRPGIKFHDGSELTAEDVKFSMDRLLTMGQGFAFIWSGKIQETEVVDKYTVVFHMKNTFGPLLSTLPSFFIVNKDLVMANIKKPGIYGDMGDYGEEYVSSYDVGSGAYMIKEYKRAEHLLMEKNPNYFLDISSAPDEFKMIGSSEPALLKTLMARRELEMTNRWLTSETLESLAKIEGVEIARWLFSNMDYICMNTKKPPLDDVHVRKALAWAFDYDMAVKLTAGSVQARGPVPLTVPGSDPNCFQYHRDLERAKMELKQSKYYGHFDEYPIECVWAVNIFKQKQSMLLMANAAEIGLTVNVKESAWTFLASLCASIETTPHLYPVTSSAYYPDALPLLQRYHSIRSGTIDSGEWLLDPVLDKMIEDAACIVNENERYAEYTKITRYIIDLCPTIFLAETPDSRAYQAAYIDWPVTKGEVIPSYKYDNCIRFIKVYPEKREELLKK